MLGEDRGSNLDELISFSREIIQVNADENTVVSFSGGKDSLVVLDLAIKSGIRKVVFSNTTVEFKETIEYIKTVEDFYGIEIKILEPPKNFFDLVDILGFPSRRLRWCCKVIKFGPLGYFAIKNKISSFITGLRHEESKKRKSYDYISRNPLIPVKQINPILDWSEKHVWEYIKRFNLPVNPLYSSGFRRIGCWVCPYKTKSDWEQTKKHSPELIESLKKRLSNFLEMYNGTGIKNKNDFITKFSWTSFAYPQVSEVTGYVKVFNDKLILNLKNHKDIEKITKILPILTNDYKIENNSIIVKSKNYRALRTIVEKALNCIGCGACLSTCLQGALEVKNSEINVIKNRCIHCKRCIKSNVIRKACIGRNYALKRKEILIIKSEEINLKNDIGLIRTKMPIDKLSKSLKKTGEISKENDVLKLKNGEFEAYVKRKSGHAEIMIFTKKNCLNKNMTRIRKALYFT